MQGIGLLHAHLRVSALRICSASTRIKGQQPRGLIALLAHAEGIVARRGARAVRGDVGCEAVGVQGSGLYSTTCST